MVNSCYMHVLPKSRTLVDNDGQSAGGASFGLESAGEPTEQVCATHAHELGQSGCAKNKDQFASHSCVRCVRAVT